MEMRMGKTSYMERAGAGFGNGALPAEAVVAGSGRPDRDGDEAWGPVSALPRPAPPLERGRGSSPERLAAYLRAIDL